MSGTLMTYQDACTDKSQNVSTVLNPLRTIFFLEILQIISYECLCMIYGVGSQTRGVKDAQKGHSILMVTERLLSEPAANDLIPRRLARDPSGHDSRSTHIYEDTG